MFEADMSIVCVLKDSYGAFIYANNYLGKLFDEPQGGFIGKTDYHLMLDEEAAIIRMHDKMVLQTGDTLVTVEHVTKNGQKESFLVKKIRLRLADNYFVAVLGLPICALYTPSEKQHALDCLNDNTDALLKHLESWYLATNSHVQVHARKD